MEKIKTLLIANRGEIAVRCFAASDWLLGGRTALTCCSVI